MKSVVILIGALIHVAVLSPAAMASQDLGQEMDALGANKEIMDKANAIDPNNEVRVVQNREVDRNLRLEIGINYGIVATGSDPFTNTSVLGGQLDFHITPHWSLGARYASYNNTLNSEGQSEISAAQANQAAGLPYHYPSMDPATNSWLAVANWYPIYGKMNLFDTSIAQFDLYLLGGAGQINLANGSEPLFTAGAGVGVWLTQHISTRLEVRWQGYQDQVWDGQENISRDINETVISATIGFLF